MRLLGRGDVEPNRVDNRGLTPLAGIVWCKYVEPMKTRPGCPDIDLNLDDRDRDGCSLPPPPAPGAARVSRGCHRMERTPIRTEPMKGDRLIPLSRAAVGW